MQATLRKGGRVACIFSDCLTLAERTEGMAVDDLRDGAMPERPGTEFRVSDRGPDPQDLTRLGEYRPITILFVDLVGSTLITQGYDREDLRDIIQKFRNVVRPIVEQWGGSNPRSIGDALMFGFGHPRTHEDDPERAVRAALQIHAELDAFGREDGIAYQAHIGIATDMILVGEEQDRRDFQSDEYYGDGPILASKLQSDAAPGETVICEATHQRVGDLFHTECLADRNYKNFGSPIDVHRVLSEVDRTTHLKRIYRPARGELVGRNKELTALMSIWEKARTQGCQIINLSGEAGIGKSRLLGAQRRHLALGKHNLVIYKCLRHHEHTPFYPFLTQLEFWAQIRNEDADDVRIDKIRGILGGILSPIQLKVITAMMVPSPAHARFLAELPREAFQEHVIDVFVTTITELVRDAPALLQFEDVHWIDSSSRRVLVHALPKLRDLPVMFVASQRTDAPPFLKGENVTSLLLQALDEAHVRDLVRALPEAMDLDLSTVDRIVRDTQGNPLFIEHYTANVLNGSLPPSDEPANIPEEIYSLLFQQIDGAGPDRGIALAATAIGRPFDTRLVAAAAGMPVDQTQDVIDRLVAHGMLTETRSTAELPYRFSHTLVQDAGYHSMVKKHRQILHERIAQHLVEERPELADRAPELLARQFRKAGITDRAIQMSLRAGELAASRFANAEAIQHAERGLSMLKQIPDAAQSALAMKLHMLLAMANSAKRGFGSAATLDGFEQAYALAKKIGDHRVLLRAAQGLFAAYHAHANYQRAGEIGAELHQMIDEIGGDLDTAHARATANRIIGGSLIWRGEFQRAHAVLSRALEHGKSPKADARAASTHHQTLASLALAEAYLGNAEAATQLSRDAISAAQATSSPMSIGNAMLMACNVHQILRHPDATAHAAALEQFAREQRMPFYMQGARSFSGVALYQDEDRIADGYAMLNDAWPKFQETAARANQVFVCVERAEGLRLMGEVEQALARIDEGLRLSETYREHNFDAELLRLRGALLIEAGDNSAEPLASLESAVIRAQGQGAKLFELRALTEIAILVARGQAGSVHLERLKDLLETFPTTHRSPDVVAAHAALAEARGNA